ncbi:MAG: Class II abasic (AP) endonuclease [Thelocarpon impressellum]|nr:MAG: Class II abasic (AP) endonuclease [Thelocarpon impressellum]
MFDLLEADIVVMQETKIQRKDLRDDMVLVPGWDCYFSLPKHKKVYTRQNKCAPIRAEEGVTGVLSPPRSSTAYRDLPGAQIGGYPTVGQLAGCPVDAATIDSEGRCVILEFPAFVLLGVYCPAARDETRDDFRLGFLHALDARVRNLAAGGKRVILTGDINIARAQMDAAHADERIKKREMTVEEFSSTPARLLFNRLLDGEEAVLWDICRAFHPDRRGMYTCWEQKVNARPGNFGARIDYVLCSTAMRGWFCDADIQEGLMGSDHCPVYATLKDKIECDGVETDVLDVMNPPGVFVSGQRVREPYRDTPALSGRLIPEFDRRGNIRDMFKRKPAVEVGGPEDSSQISPPAGTTSQASVSPKPPSTSFNGSTNKRTAPDSPTRPLKRSKSTSSGGLGAKGQQSLRGFFRSNAGSGTPGEGPVPSTTSPSILKAETVPLSTSTNVQRPLASAAVTKSPQQGKGPDDRIDDGASDAPFSPDDAEDVVDPIVAKESWSRLFTKREAPRCEHGEPCISLTTKKSGMNCGRAFWICSRPLGPTGAKERGTQWRCQTFIWSSDWNGAS